MAALTMKSGVIGNVGQGYTPGHWRPDKPCGTPVKEEGGRTPPPPPTNSSTGGRSEPSYDATEIRARGATAQNVAKHAQALAPRRYRP